MTFQMVQILGSDQAIKLAEQVVTPRTARTKVERATQQADTAFSVTTRRNREQS